MMLKYEWKMVWVTRYVGASGVLKHWIFRGVMMMMILARKSEKGKENVEIINPAKIYICDTLILNFNLMEQFSPNDTLRD